MGRLPPRMRLLLSQDATSPQKGSDTRHSLACRDKGIDHEKYYENYKVFLDAVIPTCEKYDVKLAVHPDDPAFDLFGWPRVVSSKEGIQRVLDLNPSPYNGLCLCLGSFSSRRGNDPVDAVKTFMDRIHFSHVRNIKFYD